MNHGRSFLTFCLVTWCIGLRPVYAGGDSDARALSLARANLVTADETDAFLWNPANLGLKSSLKRSKVVVNILSFGFSAGNNVVGYLDYTKYNGKTWDDKDKKNILDLFGSDNRLNGAGGGQARIGVRYLNYSFNVMFDGDAYVSAPKKLFQIALSPDGYSVGSEEVNTHGRGGGHAVLQLGASAGYSIRQYLPWRTFDDVSVGISLKYLRGFFNGTLDKARVNITESDSLITRGSYELLTSRGGNGFSADLGVTAQINKQWSAGVSVQNLFSTVVWNGQNEKHFGWYAVNSANLLDIKDDAEDTSNTIKTGSYSTYLPIIVRLGAAYQLNKTITLVGVAEHFLRTKYIAKAVPRVAAGAEFQTSKTVSLRTGMSIGGDSRGFNLAGGAGFRLGKWMLDIGTTNLEGFLTWRRFSFATSVKLVVR